MLRYTGTKSLIKKQAYQYNYQHISSVYTFACDHFLYTLIRITELIQTLRIYDL